MSTADLYASAFRRFDGTAPAWLQQRRAEGFERFAALGFPTTRLEDWKYTNLAPIARTPFQLAATSPGTDAISAALAQLTLPGTLQLVFVNGVVAPQLSTPPPAAADGARIQSLAAAVRTDPELLERHLGRYAPGAAHSLAALNTAFIADGALVHVPRGVAVSAPIHLVFLSTAAQPPSVSHPRVLLVAEESSAVTVIESYGGTDAAAYWTNAVTEIAIASNASVSHYRIQRESEAAFHTATVDVQQAADSRWRSYAVSLGGALGRVEISTVLDAPGAACGLDGLYLASGRQHVDHHTSIDHRQPHCSSRELYKGVLDGHATGVFNGKVFVRPQAQKTDAGQVNKNLLLSADAVVDTKPQLEIFADDVKCSHGATIGRLDDDAIFYLRARGIGAVEARQLLIHAFARELIDRIPVEPVRTQLDRVLWARFQSHEGFEVQP